MARGSPARAARDEVCSWSTVKQRFASGATAKLAAGHEPFCEGDYVVGYDWFAECLKQILGKMRRRFSRRDDGLVFARDVEHEVA